MTLSPENDIEYANSQVAEIKIPMYQLNLHPHEMLVLNDLFSRLSMGEIVGIHPASGSSLLMLSKERKRTL